MAVELLSCVHGNTLRLCTIGEIVILLSQSSRVVILKHSVILASIPAAVALSLSVETKQCFQA